MDNSTSVGDDRSAVVDVCTRYAFALDNHDWDALRACFLPDATSVYHGVGPLRGYDAIEGLCRAALTPLDASQHLLGNHLVEVDGDESRSTCYFHAMHVRGQAADGPQLVVAGRYDDRLVRTGQGWKIAHREQTVLWTSGNMGVLSVDV
jgi:3-phenylpropionate/cinnamic acid dioxygenase small subunit